MATAPNYGSAPALPTILATMRHLPPADLATIAELAIDWLDRIGGDCDLEDDDPAGEPLDFGEAEEWRGVLKPVYGINQTRGPINEREAVQAYHRALERGAA